MKYENFIKSIMKFEDIIDGTYTNPERYLNLDGKKEVIFGKDRKYYCPHCGEVLDKYSVIICDRCCKPLSWFCSDIHDDAIENIVGAMLESAVKDYELACEFRCLVGSNDRDYEKRKENARRFFNSPWFDILCPHLDGKALFEKLEKRCNEKKTKIK